MRIPPAPYPHVAQRLAAIWQPFTGQKWTKKNGSTVATDTFQEHRSRQSAALSFLRHRSGDAFLRTCLDADPDLPDHLVRFTSNVRLVPEPGLLARLYKAGLLSEPVRLQAVERMAELAVLTPDSGWLDADEWSILLTPATPGPITPRRPTGGCGSTTVCLPSRKSAAAISAAPNWRTCPLAQPPTGAGITSMSPST
jgi:hypothetical protein